MEYVLYYNCFLLNDWHSSIHYIAIDYSFFLNLACFYFPPHSSTFPVVGICLDLMRQASSFFCPLNHHQINHLHNNKFLKLCNHYVWVEKYCLSCILRSEVNKTLQNIILRSDFSSFGSGRGVGQKICRLIGGNGCLWFIRLRAMWTESLILLSWLPQKQSF